MTSHPIDELTYRSYRAQRVQFPNIPPSHWQLIYGAEEQRAFERRYQGEQVWPPPCSAAEAMDAARPGQSQNQLAGPTLSEVLDEDRIISPD